MKNEKKKSFIIILCIDLGYNAFFFLNVYIISKSLSNLLLF